MNERLEHRDGWTDRLSEYVDGELSARERRACEEHLRHCANCATLLRDLRHVVAVAERMNTAIEPGRDLWPDIASRLSSQPAVSQVSPVSIPVRWFRPRLAAAAVIVLAFLGAAVWFVHVQPGRTVEHATTTRPAGRSPAQHPADRDYETKVASLENEARARLTLDPRLVEVLDENLATLDAAIATYRDALAEEPDDSHLRNRLAAARRRKLEVLQQAVALAGDGTE